MLDLEDVLGKRIIHTRLRSNVTIREENAAAALEVMSRFAADPKWLIYLPPTMSPSETSRRPDLLEHPAEAFAYYRRRGRRPGDLRREAHGLAGGRGRLPGRGGGPPTFRSGWAKGSASATHGRAGASSTMPRLEQRLLDRVRRRLRRAPASGTRLDTDWLCLDCELMPWSAKAQDLLREQYAAVGAAARTALRQGHRPPGRGGRRRVSTSAACSRRYRRRYDVAGRFVDAYRRYCWPVASLDDLHLAPVPPAGLGGRRPRGQGPRLAHGDAGRGLPGRSGPALSPRPGGPSTWTTPAVEAEAIAWWEELTASRRRGDGGQAARLRRPGRRGLTQPAVKCRGREYLRIIYGPEYTLPENLERLRSRGLARKRSLALREFALGIEALERFVRGEPLRRVHECVFGVLALESEPVDPRL